MKDFLFPQKKIKRQKEIAKIPLLFDVDTYSKIPLQKPNIDSKFIIKKAKHSAEIFLSHWNHKTICFQEEYMTIYQKLDGTVLGISVDSIGDENSCSVPFHTILERAFVVKAEQIITAHNHLDLVLPSMADFECAKELKKYLMDFKNIKLADHIIINPSRKYFSFKKWFIL